MVTPAVTIAPATLLTGDVPIRKRIDREQAQGRLW